VIIFIISTVSFAQDNDTIMYWDFNRTDNRTTIEQHSGIADTASVLINGKPAKDARIGINHEIEGTDLVVFLFLEKDKTVTITIMPE